METGFGWISHYGYGALFVLLMLGIVGLPIPDETILTFIGYLCFKGELHVVPALATAFLGSASGITLSYALGRVVGVHVVLKWGPYLHLRPDHLTKTQRWITHWGKYALVIAYFIPGVRHLAALVVGTSALSLTVFAPFAYTGALLWSATFIGLGYVAGEEWKQLSSVLHHTVVIGAIMVILVLASVLLFMRRRGNLN
jgi:membrane protein DedA with SNARE-associated domain